MAQIDLTTQQVGQQYDTVENLLQNLGQVERERVNENAIREDARGEQDLISRGLGNTTIRESVKRGVQDDKNRANREITDSVSRQRASVGLSEAGATERMGNYKSGMLESFNDVYPDEGLFASLMQQAGATGAGQSGKRTTTIGPGSSNFGNFWDGNEANSSARTKSVSSGTSGGVRTFTNGGGSGGNSGITRYGAGSGGGGTGARTIAGATSGGIQTFTGGGGAQAQQGGSTPYVSNGGGTAWSDYMNAGTGFISGSNGTFSMGQDGNVTEQGTNTIELGGQPEGEASGGQMQSYSKPGLLGWQDAKSREFASAEEAKAAGYGYKQNGYMDYSPI
jgi:hypothetical protein